MVSDAPDKKPRSTPRSDAKADVDQAIRLLEWARAKGYAISALVVGSVTIPAVADLRQPRKEALVAGSANAGPRDAWEENGLDDDDIPEGTTG